MVGLRGSAQRRLGAAGGIGHGRHAGRGAAGAGGADPEVLQGDGGGRALGEDPPPAWRRYLRNPYRLPIHGNHFFLLPESWYDEHGDTGRYSRNGMLATIDMLAAIMPPFLVAALLWASVGG